LRKKSVQFIGQKERAACSIINCSMRAPETEEDVVTIGIPLSAFVEFSPDRCLCGRHEGAAEGHPPCPQKIDHDNPQKAGENVVLNANCWDVYRKLRRIDMARCDVLKLRQ
jgi:hypothetical protein